MRSPREELIAGHRAVEADLDRISESLAGGAVDLDALNRAWALLRDLYPREQAFLATIHPEGARKIARQHAEALEIAAKLDPSGADAAYLARRFVAIVQHTIIEVERDFFPLART